MLKEYKLVDEKAGIVRITTDDERWYFKVDKDLVTGLPTKISWKPSSTWIIKTGYPMSQGLRKWREEVGTEEANRRLVAGGTRGSKVHYACEAIDDGRSIDITKDKFLNPNSGQEEALTAEEILMVQNYIKCREEKSTVLLANELTVWGDVYAGTVDKIWAVPTSMPGVRQIEIIDIKTSKSITDEYALQMSSYSHGDINYSAMGITPVEWANRKLKVLRLDYGVDRRYELTEVEDCYELFRKSVYPIWKRLHEKTIPQQYTLPLTLVSEYARGQAQARVNGDKGFGEKVGIENPNKKPQ